MTTEKILERLEQLKTLSAEADRGHFEEIDDSFDEDIEAIDAAMEAVRRTIEITPPIIFKGRCYCPVCNKDFGDAEVLRGLHSWHMNYCKYCGKRLDWSEVRR